MLTMLRPINQVMTLLRWMTSIMSSITNPKLLLFLLTNHQTLSTYIVQLARDAHLNFIVIATQLKAGGDIVTGH